MANQVKRRPRDPEATRADILEAALALLSQDGPEAISLSAVAVNAGVNRGTAYQHFKTRENLVAETLKLVSDRMFRAVFGHDPDVVAKRDVTTVDIVVVTQRLATFATENTDLCRIWLLQLLALPDPSTDPFWREYAGSIGRFAQTEIAEPDIDVEPLAVISLAGNFLWPIWARSHSHGEEERKDLTDRFLREMLRLSLYGSVRAEKAPGVTGFLERQQKASSQKSLRLIK